MKIRIVGGCGSGKSYIARELSKKYGVGYYETDIWYGIEVPRTSVIPLKQGMRNWRRSSINPHGF
ncbi:hypothetical protein [Paenibacillus etheri]|uniref:hypothetical protein n=1 Tax=Paenibacillus etheri TaxID=1306852 RepID=UPI001FD82522|nr:hypothetical protein [Paenibacillus etheri]